METEETLRLTRVETEETLPLTRGQIVRAPGTGAIDQGEARS
jgi:hypothetical protein